jgi:hypothetical protein
MTAGPSRVFPRIKCRDPGALGEDYIGIELLLQGYSRVVPGTSDYFVLKKVSHCLFEASGMGFARTELKDWTFFCSFNHSASVVNAVLQWLCYPQNESHALSSKLHLWQGYVNGQYYGPTRQQD